MVSKGTNGAGLGTLVPDRIRKQYLLKFAVVVALVVVVTAGVGVYFQQRVSADVTADTHRQLNGVATSEAASLTRWVADRKQIARTTSAATELEGGNRSAIDHELDAVLTHSSGSAQEIHYIDLQTMRILESTNEDQVGQFISPGKVTWMQGSWNLTDPSTVAVSDGYDTANGTVVAFVSRIEGTHKAVMLTYDTTALANGLQTVSGGYTQAVNRDGRIILTENQSLALTTYQEGADSPVLKRAFEGNNGTMNRASTKEVLAYAPVEGTDWAVVAHVPESKAYALRSAVNQALILLIGLALLGFVVLGTTIGRNTVHALVRIRDTAGSIADGDLDVQVSETDRIDEVGQALDAFDDTVAYLNTVADQAEALAAQEFDASVLDDPVPGALGVSLQQMNEDLSAFVSELERRETEANEAREQAEQLASTLERKAEAFSDVMARAAEGDLTQRLDESVDNAAMAEIAAAFNEMLADLEATLVRIQDFSDDVAGASEQASASATEVRDASETVSRSVQEIAEGAARQDETIQRASSELTDMSATIEEIASSANEVATTTDEAADLGTDGSENAAAAIEEMDAIERQTDAAIGEVERLDEEMARIGEIVDLIDDIAEQTNILALNASIEAARAGEAGSGFAVVADEVKQLAEETQQATDEIEAAVQSVQSTTTETVADMQAMGERVSDGMSTVETALETLEAIVAKVEDANAGVQSIDDATDEQAASTEEVVAMVDEVGSVSEQTTAQAQSAAASAQEQTASISEVTDNVSRLSTKSADLNDLLAEFDVRDDETALDDADRTTPGTAQSALDTDD